MHTANTKRCGNEVSEDKRKRSHGGKLERGETVVKEVQQGCKKVKIDGNMKNTSLLEADVTIVTFGEHKCWFQNDLLNCRTIEKRNSIYRANVFWNPITWVEA